MEKKFISYNNLILSVDEIVSVHIDKLLDGERVIKTTLKNGTVWTSSGFDSHDELLRTFGDIQKALNVIDGAESSAELDKISKELRNALSNTQEK